MTAKFKKIAKDQGAANEYEKTLHPEPNVSSSRGTRKVGYGNPPIETRFRPGMSGNPNGRPKGRKNLRTAFTEILTEKIAIRIGNKAKRVTRLEAVLMTTLDKALKGDPKAIQAINNTANALGLMDYVPQKLVLGDLGSFSGEELVEFERLLLKASARVVPK